jgi:wyosine [tRNA(Phe)-imidazoG37] synthetase (radical SAM superfamily)
MSIVYGPVPSRRLGQSLGVDPIPFKTCNYNCVYCQLGRTHPLINRRQDFYPPEMILAEVRAALAAHPPGAIDYVTFVGQGEPLLCASLGRLLAAVKAMSNLPVALITNGSLLFQPDVRAEVQAADVVMPTVDAADQATFRRINRPWRRLQVEAILAGMAEFRQIYAGQLWVEVMLVKGVNDGEAALTGIAAALRRIQPDQVHLNVPLRPPAERWVEPPDNLGMVRAMAILGEVAPIVTPASGAVVLAPDMPIADAVVEIIRRHPLREAELVEELERYTPGQVAETLAALQASGQARRLVYRDQAYWEYPESRFA